MELRRPIGHFRPWLALFQTDFVALADDAFREHVKDQHEAALLADDVGVGHAARGADSEPASGELRDEGLADNVSEVSSDTHSEEPEGPPLVLTLPTEVYTNVFSRLDAESLSAAAQTCIAWRAVAYDPQFWRRLACRTWPAEPLASLERRLWTPIPPQPAYQTWRKLMIYRPRMRANGIYVQRHQYAKSRGRVVGDGTVAPVFLVTYYRFLRFFPDGTVLSLISPELPERAYRRLRPGWQPTHLNAKKAHPTSGTYALDESTRTVSITLPTAQEKLYPDMMKGVQHLTMSLTETHDGAFNRLYLRDHFAVMDNGDLVTYQSEFSMKSWHFIPLHGFRTRVYDHFPREATPDGKLANWISLGKATAVEDAGHSGS